MIVFEFSKLEHDSLVIVFQFLELRRDSVIFRNDCVRVLQTGAWLARYHVPVFGTETWFCDFCKWLCSSSPNWSTTRSLSCSSFWNWDTTRGSSTKSHNLLPMCRLAKWVGTLECIDINIIIIRKNKMIDLAIRVQVNLVKLAQSAKPCLKTPLLRWMDQL